MQVWSRRQACLADIADDLTHAHPRSGANAFRKSHHVPVSRHEAIRMTDFGKVAVAVVPGRAEDHAVADGLDGRPLARPVIGAFVSARIAEDRMHPTRAERARDPRKVDRI